LVPDNDFSGFRPPYLYMRKKDRKRITPKKNNFGCKEAIHEPQSYRGNPNPLFPAGFLPICWLETT
jgi:hypothetical protein